MDDFQKAHALVSGIPDFRKDQSAAFVQGWEADRPCQRDGGASLHPGLSVGINGLFSIRSQGVVRQK
jgi:hypothetical protein